MPLLLCSILRLASSVHILWQCGIIRSEALLRAGSSKTAAVKKASQSTAETCLAQWEFPKIGDPNVVP